MVFLPNIIRFRSFNKQFEEVCQTQINWAIPDKELRDNVILAVAEIVSPAYRSFVKRFGYFSHLPRLSCTLFSPQCFSVLIMNEGTRFLGANFRIGAGKCSFPPSFPRGSGHLY